MPGVSTHAPVLVGGGQITDRPDDPTTGLDPLALMEAATRRALEDARAGAAALEAVDTLVVVNVLCHNFGDAAGLLAERLGIHPARALNSTVGGNTPQSLVNHLSGESAAAPMTPRPPALDTAATSGAIETPPMPARKMGYSMPKRSQIGVLSMRFASFLTRGAVPREETTCQEYPRTRPCSSAAGRSPTVQTIPPRASTRSP